MRILKLDNRYYLHKHAKHTHQLRWDHDEYRPETIRKLEKYLTDSYKPPVWIKHLVTETDWWLGWESVHRKTNYIVSLPNERLLTLCLMIL